jgi:AraC-like DNA-binding protein
MPKLAVDLGYFDQAHFINDFKALVGTTPAAYAQQNAAGIARTR